MQNITLHSHIGADGILHLDIPVKTANTEVEITLTIKPVDFVKPFPPTDLKAGLGCANYTGKTQSLEDMEQGINKTIKKQWLNEN